MTITSQRVPLSTKESEAFMWGLAQIGDYVSRITDDAADPLFILLAAGWSRRSIADACEELMPVVCTGSLTSELSPLERTILRLCVENTTWIDCYRTHEITADNPVLIEEALSTLRSLAAKLEQLGIEVNHIPFD